MVETNETLICVYEYSFKYILLQIHICNDSALRTVPQLYLGFYRNLPSVGMCIDKKNANRNFAQLLTHY